MLPRFVSAVALPFAVLAHGAGASAAEEPRRDPTADELGAWLETTPASADVSKAPEALEAPPPPPRRHGFVAESSIGVLGHIGAMNHVSPAAPWFRGAFGWEPTKWLMLLAQGDISVSNTSYAAAPPAPRGYAMWGLSGALRFGLSPTPAIGLFVQGEIGATRVTENVLSTYGFKDATSVGPFFGGLAGVEWYQLSPHYALAAQGGVRSYGEILSRAVDSGSALAWVGAASLKYTF